MKEVRSSALRTGRLHPQEFSWYSFLEAESTPVHMVRSVASEKKSPATPLGIDPETFRLVAQCLNHYAQAPYIYIFIYIRKENSRIESVHSVSVCT
jgi:hypothetical protein